MKQCEKLSDGLILGWLKSVVAAGLLHVAGHRRRREAYGAASSSR
jgi:hypothetical protein